MGVRINQNVMALNAYRNLSGSEMSLTKSLERLSSGFRINRAADDAAGLVISEGLRSQITGLKMATRNAEDGVSVVQTAEGALTETHAILQRIRQLAVQAASTGSSDQPSRDAAQTEVAQLKNELDRIANTTKFGQQTLLDGTYGVTNVTAPVVSAASTIDTTTTNKFALWLHIASGVPPMMDVALTSNRVFDANTGGAANAAALEQDINNGLQTTFGPIFGAGNVPVHAKVAVAGSGAAARFLTTFSADYTFDQLGVFKDNGGAGTAADVSAALGVPPGGIASAIHGSGGMFQVGSGSSVSDQISISIGSMTSLALGVSHVDVSNAASSTANIAAVDTAITTVSTLRGNLGAYQNRFEHTISNLSITTENLSASESRIRDTDMASEMMSFTRAQILQQAGTAMLAQANAVPQTVLQLLK